MNEQLITMKQIAYIWSLARKLDIQEDRLKKIYDIQGSLKEISKVRARDIIEDLNILVEKQQAPKTKVTVENNAVIVDEVENIETKETETIAEEIVDDKTQEKTIDAEKIATNDFLAIEKYDEMQIEDELKGIVLDAFVYKVRGKNVLSYAGVKQLALARENITIGEPRITDQENFWMAAVSATDTIKNITTWGVSTQPVLMKLSEEHAFCWEHVPGPDTKRFTKFITEKIGIDWAKKEMQIKKSENGRTIEAVLDEKHYIVITLDNYRTKAVLETSDRITYEFYTKVENSKLNVFKKEEYVPDPFCIQKAVSKSIRNAIRALLPESYILSAIEKWQKERNKK